MTHRLSIAHLSAITLPPPAFIETAAEARFEAVGLRLLRVTDDSPGYPLMDDPAALRATIAALRATGMAVHDIEFVKLTPDTDIARLEPLLDAGASLGARHLITAPYDPDLGRLAGTLCALSERARLRGIGTVLEFFPWTSVPDLATCLHVVGEAGPDVGILIDSLHFDRSVPDYHLLRRIPKERIPFAHLCDAPRFAAYTTEMLLHAARAERLPPGLGEIDLRQFLDALPAQIDLALEVPMTQMLEREGALRVFRHLHKNATEFLAGALPPNEGRSGTKDSA